MSGTARWPQYANQVRKAQAIVTRMDRELVILRDMCDEHGSPFYAKDYYKTVEDLVARIENTKSGKCTSPTWGLT